MELRALTFIKYERLRFKKHCRPALPPHLNCGDPAPTVAATFVEPAKLFGSRFYCKQCRCELVSTVVRLRCPS